ncbi:MAG: ComEC/Rec2 family competence protein, partial [Akkermansia sp.]
MKRAFSSASKSLRHAVYRAPLVSVALTVICSVLAVHESGFFVIPALLIPMLLCSIKTWRLVLLCLILGMFAGGIALRQNQVDEAMMIHENQMTYGDSLCLETSGSIVKTFQKSAWIQCDHLPPPLPPHARMEIIPPEGITMKLGEKWAFRAVTKSIPPLKTPGGFDRRNWLRHNHITCRLQCISAHREGEGSLWSQTLALSEAWRNSVAETLACGSSMQDTRVQVMVSLLLGDKRQMARETLDSFREGGCLHVFAVSGLHVGLAAGLIFFALIRCRLHPITARLLTLPALVIYVFVTGMSVSAMRALVMICLFFIGTAFRQKVHAINILSLAVILFLLWEPAQLYDAGFLLSFLIFAIIVLVGSWETHRPPWWRPDPLIPTLIYTRREKFSINSERKIRIAIVLSLCCWLAAIPVTIACFGTFNLYSAALNIAIVPLIPPLMASCILGVVFFWCSPILLAINAFSRYLAAILLSVTGFFADQPQALVPWSLPAQAGQALILPLASGECTLALGNPALIINPGSIADATFTVIPALQSQGFTPHAVLLTHWRKNKTQGIEPLTQQYPKIIRVGNPLKEKTSSLLTTPTGDHLSILMTSNPWETNLMDDASPLVLWEHQGKKLLYLGNAPFASFTSIASSLGHIDLVIVGAHPKDPIPLDHLLRLTGATTLIMLPNGRSQEPSNISKNIHLYRPAQEGWLSIDMSSTPPRVKKSNLPFIN